MSYIPSNPFISLRSFLQDPDSPEVSDWVKYAESEYDNLTHEDGGNDNLDDASVRKKNCD